MCDAPELLCDPFQATLKVDDPSLNPPRPSTLVPDHSRMLRGTISHASIETVCPLGKKGVHQHIEEIAENVKRKSEVKKKKKHAGTRDGQKHVDDVVLGSKASLESRAVKRGWTAVSPLQDYSHWSAEDSSLAVTNRLHTGVPFELELLMLLCVKSDTLIDVLLFKEDGVTWEDYSLPVRTLGLGIHVTLDPEDKDINNPPLTAKIEDIQLNIMASEKEVTIWDGLQAVSLQDVHLVEMECNMRPSCSTYARPPTIQASYDGATPDCIANPDEPNVKLPAGIHMDQIWCKIKNDNDTWGWYRDAFIPLSLRLFNKADYREFKLVSKVWVGECWIDDELTFGISMLLRGLDMSV